MAKLDWFVSDKEGQERVMLAVPRIVAVVLKALKNRGS